MEQLRLEVGALLAKIEAWKINPKEDVAQQITQRTTLTLQLTEKLEKLTILETEAAILAKAEKDKIEALLSIEHKREEEINNELMELKQREDDFVLKVQHEMEMLQKYNIVEFVDLIKEAKVYTSFDVSESATITLAKLELKRKKLALNIENVMARANKNITQNTKLSEFVGRNGGVLSASWELSDLYRVAYQQYLEADSDDEDRFITSDEPSEDDPLYPLPNKNWKSDNDPVFEEPEKYIQRLRQMALDSHKPLSSYASLLNNRYMQLSDIVKGELAEVSLKIKKIKRETNAKLSEQNKIIQVLKEEFIEVRQTIAYMIKKKNVEKAAEKSVVDIVALQELMDKNQELIDEISQLKDKAGSTEREMRKLQREIKSIKAEKDSNQSKQDDLEEDLLTAEKEIEQLKEKVVAVSLNLRNQQTLWEVKLRDELKAVKLEYEPLLDESLKNRIANTYLVEEIAKLKEAIEILNQKLERSYSDYNALERKLAIEVVEMSCQTDLASELLDPLNEKCAMRKETLTFKTHNYTELIEFYHTYKGKDESKVRLIERDMLIHEAGQTYEEELRRYKGVKHMQLRMTLQSLDQKEIKLDAQEVQINKLMNEHTVQKELMMQTLNKQLLLVETLKAENDVRQTQIEKLQFLEKQKQEDFAKILFEETQKIKEAEKQESLKKQNILKLKMAKLAYYLSNLPEENYYVSPQKKFFSYQVSVWENVWHTRFGFNKFCYLNLKKLNLDNSKILFQLLCNLNTETGSKSHIWYGNELNRVFNKRDHRGQQDEMGKFRRAQDTFLGWFDEDSNAGFACIERAQETNSAQVYKMLLNSIGNVSIPRTPITTNGVFNRNFEKFDYIDSANLENLEKNAKLERVEGEIKPNLGLIL